jgi:membrane protein implicated in regulation of membrane protease activity
VTRRTTGWLLLALALLGAAFVAGLGWREGAADPWLVAIAAAAVAAAVLTVMVDRRVLARRPTDTQDGGRARAGADRRGSAGG